MLSIYYKYFNSYLSISGIPHLAVSNSTPPPSSPPGPVKIKSEPISPPRDQMMNQQQQQQQQQQHQSMGSSIGLGHQSSSTLGNNLNHSHMMNSRPSSTGHLTPTPGKIVLENFDDWKI